MSDDEALRVVDAAWEGGIRYFDTAPHYGLGLSERRLGAALARHPRQDYLLSTKVGRLLEPTPENADRIDDQGFVVPAAYRRVWDASPAGVRRSLDREPGADRHGPDRHRLPARPGRVRPRGRRRHRAARVGRREGVAVSYEPSGSAPSPSLALAAAVRTGLCDLIMVAGRLTLLDQSGAELLELCREHGVGIVNVGVFNSGALAADAPSPELHFEYAPITPERLAELERVHDVCARFGVSVADAALQYSWQLPEVVNVTVGASAARQIRASIAGMDTEIDPALWPALAAVV